MRFRTTALTTVAALVVALAGCAASGTAGAGEAGPGKSWARDLPVTRLTPLGDEDGFVPEGGGLDPADDVPALSELDPDLMEAVREAADAALEEAGIEVLVTSGWRSERYQRYLLESAVKVYGSEEEAARWVASPQDSSHVQGAAVDVGLTDAAYWFVEHGARFGLCQTYANEVWHYELTVEPGETCPTPLEDASAG